ncbi:hypothetical protein JW948_12615 [bacterium]|nr:hypothetical protein [bacterium]
MSTNHNAKFRYNALERWFPLAILLPCAGAAWLIAHDNMPFAALLIIIGLYWLYRLICAWTCHFIVFEEKGVSVRMGVFMLPRHFRFDQITNIRTIKPDRHIHFQINSTHDIQLPLSRLKKKDRIRFIFLIESDVNRLSINAPK